jgi:hypothetical protein
VSWLAAAIAGRPWRFVVLHGASARARIGPGFARSGSGRACRSASSSGRRSIRICAARRRTAPAASPLPASQPAARSSPRCRRSRASTHALGRVEPAAAPRPNHLPRRLLQCQPAPSVRAPLRYLRRAVTRPGACPLFTALQEARLPQSTRARPRRHLIVPAPLVGAVDRALPPE